MNGPLFEVQVSQIHDLTPRVKELVLCATGPGKLPQWNAGAHVPLYLPSTGRSPIIRHYSLISGKALEDDPPNTYRIAVQREVNGRGSNYLHDCLKTGETLKIGMPINGFPLDRQAERVLLLAAGIGITPLISMTRSLRQRQKPFSLIYCGHSLAQMPYAQELQALYGHEVHLHMSQTHGRISLLTLLSEQAPNTHIYVCGPQEFLKATRKAADALDWPKEQLHQETFVSSTQVGDTPFEVKLARSHIQVEVGGHESLLEVLCEPLPLPSSTPTEPTGSTLSTTPIYWSCRKGECGLCVTKVVSFKGELVHRDRYLSREEKELGQLICLCVSRLKGQSLVLDL